VGRYNSKGTSQTKAPMSFETSLAGQKILVTGASGFLGAHVSRRLHDSGVHLCAVSRTAPRDDAFRVPWTSGDVSDWDNVKSLFHEFQPNVVFHLSGHGVGAPGIEHVLPTVQHDLMTTVNILTASTQFGVKRLVLAASLEEPVQGSSEGIPSTPYAAAKFSSTMYARMFHKLYGTPVVQVRPFMTYGPGQRAHKLIPYVTLALLQGQSPKLGSGQRPVDWVYVDDVIDGMLAAALAPKIEGSAIDLGSGHLVTIREVVMQLVDIVGAPVQPQFGAVVERPMEKIRAADLTAARENLGWKPRTPLHGGLELTVKWFREELAVSAAHHISRGSA
jgi:UDP-glucose 4-epimerase